MSGIDYCYIYIEEKNIIYTILIIINALQYYRMSNKLKWIYTSEVLMSMQL